MDKYGCFRLKTETIKNLQVLKRAYEASYGNSFTNDDIIDKLILGIEDSDCNVYEIYGKMQEDEEIYRKMAKKRKDSGSSL